MGQVLATLGAIFTGLGDMFVTFFNFFANLRDYLHDVAYPPTQVEEPPAQPKFEDFDIGSAYSIVDDFHTCIRPLLIAILEHHKILRIELSPATLSATRQRLTDLDQCWSIAEQIYDQYETLHDEMAALSDAMASEMAAEHPDVLFMRRIKRHWYKTLRVVEHEYQRLFGVVLEVTKIAKETKEVMLEMRVWDALVRREAKEEDQKDQDAEFRAMLATLD